MNTIGISFIRNGIDEVTNGQEGDQGSENEFWCVQKIHFDILVGATSHVVDFEWHK
jgi:hypothetical protein